MNHSLKNSNTQLLCSCGTVILVPTNLYIANCKLQIHSNVLHVNFEAHIVKHMVDFMTVKQLPACLVNYTQAQETTMMSHGIIHYVYNLHNANIVIQLMIMANEYQYRELYSECAQYFAHFDRKLLLKLLNLIDTFCAKFPNNHICEKLRKLHKQKLMYDIHTPYICCAKCNRTIIMQPTDVFTDNRTIITQRTDVFTNNRKKCETSMSNGVICDGDIVDYTWHSIDKVGVPSVLLNEILLDSLTFMTSRERFTNMSLYAYLNQPLS